MTLQLRKPVHVDVHDLTDTSFPLSPVHSRPPISPDTLLFDSLLPDSPRMQRLQALVGSNAYVDRLMGNPALDVLPLLKVHQDGHRHMAVFHKFTSRVLREVRGSSCDKLSTSPGSVAVSSGQPHGWVL